MKDESEIVACVIDYGSFISLADRLSRTYKKVYYYSPFEQEFQGIKTSCIGDGLPRAERMDDFMHPDVIKEVDLWCFPDIGYGGLQKYLRSIEKLVWGSMGASDLELYRTRFLKLMETLELPVVSYKKLVGLTALADYLKTVKNKWVKINRYREDMETWHHHEYKYSVRKLETLAVKFGGLKERVIFVVQDAIEDAREIGYDGLTVNGLYPAQSFSGYEKKNELYLGSLLDNSDLPDQVQLVNETMAPVYEEYQYRNFIATELRIKEDVTYFIDPTMRMAGQTMEHQYETCLNLPEVILKGAAGEMIAPDFTHLFAAEATIHYTEGEPDDWKVLDVPEKAVPWTKLYHYCMADGLCHFPPHRTDEVGVICGAGDTVQEAIDNLKAHFALFENAPLCIRHEGFVDLLKEIHTAEEDGIEFTHQPVPDPETALDL